MPGRGTPWRGVGKGQQDRIGSGEIEDDSLLSEDIKDGTIKEIDLDTALQAKVNAVGGGGHVIEDEGTPLAQQTNLNFVGAGVTAIDSGGKTVVTIPSGADGVGYDTVDEEGSPLTKRSTLRFIGELITAQDSESTTTITVDPLQIQDEGVNLNAKRGTINFVGEGVVATDGPGQKTTVTIAGGAGSGIFDPFTVDPLSYHYLFDDFFYPNPDTQIANFPWERIGASGINVPTGTVGGVIEVSSGSIANNIVGLRTCAGGLVAVNVGKKFKVVWAIRQTTAIVSSAQRIGLFAEALAPSGTFPFSSEPNPNLWFAHDGSGNWLAQTDNQVTPVSIDTGVAVDTLQHVFEISFDPAGTPTVTFKIDGVSVATSTANIPTGNLSAGVVIQTGIASSKVHQIDTALIVNDR